MSTNPLERYDTLISRIQTIHPNAPLSDTDYNEMIAAIHEHAPELDEEIQERSDPSFVEGVLVGLAHAAEGNNNAN